MVTRAFDTSQGRAAPAAPFLLQRLADAYLNRADSEARRPPMIPAPRRSGAPRQGNPVLADGEPVGLVTSGTFSPSLEQGIGMAYVRRDLAEPGTELEIDVRGRRRAARVEKRPLLSLADGRT